MKKANSGKQVLTKGEMDLMRKLWAMGDAATIKQLMGELDEPKPAYTTVATFMKILSAKGFVSEEKRADCGKALFYKPLVSQEEYTRRVMDDVTTNFFGGSVRSLVNFFVREEKIGEDELKQLLNMIENHENEHEL